MGCSRVKREQRVDAWRRLGEDWPDDFGLSEVEVSLPGFMPQTVELYGGLTLVCGSNASGKSRILRAISAALCGEEDAQVRVRIIDGATQKSCPADGQSPFEVVVVEPFFMCHKQRLSLLTDANLDDRIEQADPHPLTEKELGLVRYLMGREYESVTVRELDETDETTAMSLGHLKFYGTDVLTDIVPYFEIEYRGRTYGSLEMSLGELAGLSLFWALRRCQHHQHVLIEEPETFLSPQSAQRAIEVVAHFAGDRKFSCLVSTHSYLGLAGAPGPHTLLLAVADGMTSLVPATQGSIWRTLGVAAPKSLVLLVEDEAALQWLKSLLVRLEFDAFDETDICSVHGSGEVRKGAVFPRFEGERHVVYGVLDGDERGKPFEGRILFLPGAVSIEQLILSVLKGEVEGAGPLPWSGAGIGKALDDTEGLEPHERVDLISTSLGQSLAALREKVLDSWLASDDGRAALEQFAAELNQLAQPRMLE
jgi:hypothetical protein